MRTFKLVCFASILAASFAHATAPCNGFQIKIKNNTADDLLMGIQLDGAHIQPDIFQKLNSHSEQIFTISNSADHHTLNGYFELHSISLPSKKTSIAFDLKNKQLICIHKDKGIQSDYRVSKRRLLGHVSYTIE